MSRDSTPDQQPDIEQIQQILFSWYRANSRDLPWRNTRDPYSVLVSEVMLQQTQVDRVIPKYHAFLEAFPSVRALADAPTSEVIRIWSGLGYNRRAVNLQRAAQTVAERHNGVFPSSIDELKKLPGIGPYTAGAIACFAFEQDVGFMDTNIRRLVHRLFAGPEVPQESLSERQLQELTSSIVPSGRGWEWGQSLIEFGALQCTARKPACLTCPLQMHCAAFPQIQTILAALSHTGFRRKNEATFQGSNRFYRGRVIRALQYVPEDGDGLDLNELGPHVREDYSPDHQEWLRSVVDGLARDGLLEIAEERPGYDAAPGPKVRLPGIRPAAHEAE